MPDVHVPGIGNVPRGAVIAGGIGAVTVTGYMIYRHNKAAAATPTGAAAGYGYGAGAYGYAGYYGYGSEFQPYPPGEEYGYGAYGYGMYNPYTGQYVGPGGGGGYPYPLPPQPPNPPGSQGPKSGWFKIGNKKYYYSADRNTIGYYTGKGKHRVWHRTKV